MAAELGRRGEVEDGLRRIRRIRIGGLNWCVAGNVGDTVLIVILLRS